MGALRRFLMGGREDDFFSPSDMKAVALSLGVAAI